MVLHFTGLLSVNLAIMNLLPIPALDGGRALFIMLEKVVGRHRVQKVEGYANYGGFIVLIGLILLITARDVWRLFV
jgi:regulator of sigma E protease